MGREYEKFRRVGEKRAEDGSHEYVHFEGPVPQGALRVSVVLSTPTLLRVKIHHDQWDGYFAIPITLKPEE